MTTTDFVGWAFSAVMTFTCVRNIADGSLRREYDIFRDRTGKDWVEILAGALACLGVIVLAAKIVQYLPGILHWSWLSLIASKGDNPEGGNLNLSGAAIPFFGVVFVLLLMINLPWLARNEEEMFRVGTRGWLDAVPRSILFGLIHMVVGVPLWAGLAIAIPGFWFSYQYFRGGVERSTMAHSVYNFILASVLFAYVVQGNLAAPHR